MNERQKQSHFAVMAAQLILKAVELGYEVTLGDAYRDPRVHGEYGVAKGYGAARSFHKKRLAIDLNLFKDNKWLRDTEDHAVLGAWWERHGGTWGGRFPTPDGNHYSYGEGR